MANFQFRGYKVKNVDFSLTNPTFQKFASLAKIPHFCLSNPEIEKDLATYQGPELSNWPIFKSFYIPPVLSETSQ